jgi:branched-chain amino acid transport system substrate-binding protein
MLALVALVTASCGTRISHTEVVRAARGSSSAASTDSLAENAEPSSGAVTGDNGSSSSADNAPGKTTAVSGTELGGAPTGGGSRPTANPQLSPGGNRSSGPQGAGPKNTGVPGTAGGSAKSDAVVASVSTLSGPVGANFVPWIQAVQAWVRLVNSRGGVNGHTVRLVTFDDGGDPARHRAQVQEAVERKGVIGFINAEPLAGPGSVEYHNAKRVPVIVSSGAESWGLKSPMYFIAAATGDDVARLIIAGAAGLLVPRGRTKVGWIVCVEAAICDQIAQVWTEEAPRLGFQPVYKGRASIAQPDYTAECLAARSAGAEVFIVGLDAAGFQRAVAACLRQNYRPYFISSQGSLTDGMKDNPVLEGMIAATSTFPFFQHGTPATDEFHRTLRQYAPGITMSATTSLGWTAAKLFEKAARQLPEPPTSEALLQGLWSMNNDDLGGLTQPLTFAQDKPPVSHACWFDVILVKQSWTSPDGFKIHCR